MLDKQLFRFLLIGAFAAIVNVAARFAFDLFLAFEIAVLLAYPFGLLTAYGLNRAFVFGPSGRGVASELGRFLAVNLVAVGLIWAVSVGLARIVFPSISFTWHADDIAHAIGVMVPALTSYLGHRHYSFRQG